MNLIAQGLFACLYTAVGGEPPKVARAGGWRGPLLLVDARGRPQFAMATGVTTVLSGTKPDGAGRARWVARLSMVGGNIPQGIFI